MLVAWEAVIPAFPPCPINLLLFCSLRNHLLEREVNYIFMTIQPSGSANKCDNNCLHTEEEDLNKLWE